MREVTVKEIKRVTDKKQPPAWLLEAGKKINKESISIDAPITVNKKENEDEINTGK